MAAIRLDYTVWSCSRQHDPQRFPRSKKIPTFLVFSSHLEQQHGLDKTRQQCEVELWSSIEQHGLEKKRQHEVERSSIQLEKTRDYYLRAAKGIYLMTRPWNLLPSFALSFGGGWISSGHNFGILLVPNLWIASICSAIVSAASMLVNDYYDHKSGTDKMNGKLTEMQSQEIDPSDVVVASGCLYGMTVFAACFLEPVNLRLSVVISALVTLLYTPLLKKVTLVKNIVVAGIVANAVTVGGMATGRSAPSFIGAYVFLMILGREIVMDVKDVVGDKETGVRTTAVCFGVRRAVVLAWMVAIAAQALLITMLSTHGTVGGLLTTLSAFPLCHGLFSLLDQRVPDRADVERVVSEFMASMVAGGVVAAVTLQ